MFSKILNPSIKRNDDVAIYDHTPSKMKIDLKQFRKAKKLSQETVGLMFGTGQTNISMLEKDERNLTDEQYKILVDKYGEDEILKYAINNTAKI